MNKNYANDDVISVKPSETAVVYSRDCENVVVLFNDKKGIAGLADEKLPFTKKQAIIEGCKELGCPNKFIYTEIEGSDEKCFSSSEYNGSSALSIVVRKIKGKYQFVITEAVQKELERIM